MKIYCPKCLKAHDLEIPAGTTELPCPVCNGPMKIPDGPLAPGAVIGDFLLERELSSGGMGMVYLAKQISLDRPVALKVLHEKFADNKEYIDGLFREARAAAKLTHPNIVQAYAVGEENGICYFAMEYIRGETFKQILKRESPLKIEQAVKVIKEICGALQVAWNEQKLVHQDIKPDNIMLDGNGFAKLADLGLARSANNGDASALDSENEVMGTPQYISPEQLTGVPTDVRSDIYSLGATFYQFVTGSFPYPEKSAEEMAKKHVEGNLTPPKARNPEIPDAVNDIIVKMMARNIDERYQTPSEIINDLEKCLAQPPKGKLPQLKIKLKGEPAAAPGTPAKPTIPGKGVSGLKLTLPGTPAKPVVPAKPAVPGTPAKPVVPDKPAAPAQEPVQAQPVTTAPEAEPAPEAKGNGDDVALVPKAPKPAETEEEKDGREAKKKGKEKDDTKGKNSRKERFGRPSRNTSAIIFAIALPLLLLAAAAVLYFVCRSRELPGKLKEPGKKYAALINGWFGIKAAAPASGTADAQLPSKPQLTPPPPKPVTRPELASSVEKLLSDFRSAPGEYEKFLKQCDEFFARFGQPVTAEERQSMDMLRSAFAPVDERARAMPAREKIRKKLLARQEAEIRKAADEARRKREEALAAARYKQEIEQQQAAQKKLQQEMKEAERKRTAKLKSDLELLYRSMVDGFFKSLNGDTDALNSAVTAAKDYFIPSTCNTPEELAAIADFKKFYTPLPGRFADFIKFRQTLAKISPEFYFSMPIPGGKIVNVISVVPGKVQYREVNGTLGVLNMKNVRTRNVFFTELVRKLKIRHARFYYEFMELDLSRAAMQEIPVGFWKTYLHRFAPPLKMAPPPKAPPPRKVSPKKKAAPKRRAAAVKKAPVRKATVKKAPARKATVKKSVPPKTAAGK